MMGLRRPSTSSSKCSRELAAILGCAVVVWLLRAAFGAATSGDITTTTSGPSSSRSSPPTTPSPSSQHEDESATKNSASLPRTGTMTMPRAEPDNESRTAISTRAPALDQADGVRESRKIKVCVLVEPSPFHYISGYSGRFQNLVLHLKARGDDVQVVVPATDPQHKGGSRNRTRNHSSEVWNGVPIHFTGGVRLSPWYPDLVVSVDYALRIPRILWKMKPDLIHVSSPGFLVFAAVLYGRLLRIPVIASYHTHLPVYVQSHYLPKPLRNLAACLVWLLIRAVHGSMVDMTVVTSPQIRDEFIRNGVPAHKCRLWRKGIDPDTFHPRHARAQMRQRMSDHHPDDFVLLYVGRLSVEKRLALLRPVLDHLDRLNRSSDNSTATSANVRLCFVGSGPQECELRTLFEGTPTVFMGVLTGNELSQAFASADAFVMPSDSETLGFVVLEAMASGVVPVVAEAGGLVDLVEHDTTGFLVETSQDPDEFAERFASYVHRLQSDPPLRQIMAHRAREETLQWSWSESMESLRVNEYWMAMRGLRDR